MAHRKVFDAGSLYKNDKGKGKSMILHPIAIIENGFPEKFGIPRQSCLADTLARIVFEPEYRNKDALKGLEEYSHIWLLWEFSESVRDKWSPTVRPPRLGGNKRKGVFATRSPFRPNPIGLSVVELTWIEWQTPKGPVLHIKGADLMNGTPIYDIKPYLPHIDSRPEASGGFSAVVKEDRLKVEFPGHLRNIMKSEDEKVLCQILRQDPRPSYQNDPERIYGMQFEGWEIKFRVEEDELYVCGIEPIT